MEEPQNIYDNPDFFIAYSNLRAEGSGLNEVLEQPALWSMLPKSLAGLRVLDLGCGFGDFARKARRAGASCVLGIDCSERMLARAEESTTDPHIQYCRMSIEELQCEAHHFDLVISSLAIHYVRDYRSVIRRIATALKKGGRLLFSVEHPICTSMAQQKWILDDSGAPLFWPVDQYRNEGARNTRWFDENVIKYHRTMETYVNELLQAGFRLLELREPAPVEQALSAKPLLQIHQRRPPFLLLSAEL
jgi:ubiquinone/menaquinone biosynthesis C-methylase UbiE